MAGELSKKIGEEGEELARSLLKRIGWKIATENIDIPCGSPPDHQKKETGAPAHGIDFVVAYDCPLVHGTRRNVLISTKNSQVERTKTQESRVRDDLKDLDRAISCYKISKLRVEINQDSGAEIIEDVGVLIKINKDSDDAESFLKTADTNTRLDLHREHELHFIENKRFDLVDLATKWLSDERRDGKYCSFYQPTTSNYAADVAQIQGELVPLHHLIAGPLTFRCIKDGQKEFIIFSPEDFTRTALERLIGLANGCSNGWANKITIIFSELNQDQKDEAKSAMLGIRDQSLAGSIDVTSMEPRMRIR